jgi:predicted extracellular nuclease
MAIGNDDDIRWRAYQIWEEEGRPEGREVEHWQRAADELTAPRGHARVTAADADLSSNTGIGQSIGATGADPDEIGGANTVEGDVLNDVTPSGGINPDQRGRTNK